MILDYPTKTTASERDCKVSLLDLERTKNFRTNQNQNQVSFSDFSLSIQLSCLFVLPRRIASFVLSI